MNTSVAVERGPDRLLLDDGPVVCLPNLVDIVKHAKVLGWRLHENVNPEIGQTLTVVCGHGHGPMSVWVDEPHLPIGAAVTTIDLQGMIMHYTPASIKEPVRHEETLRAYIWRGQCYECSTRHIGFNRVPAWVVGMVIVRYAVETADVNVMGWLRQTNYIWGNWVSDAPPARLAENLFSWAKGDIERYG